MRSTGGYMGSFRCKGDKECGLPELQSGGSHDSWLLRRIRKLHNLRNEGAIRGCEQTGPDRSSL